MATGVCSFWGGPSRPSAAHMAVLNGARPTAHVPGPAGWPPRHGNTLFAAIPFASQSAGTTCLAHSCSSAGIFASAASGSACTHSPAAAAIHGSQWRECRRQQYSQAGRRKLWKSMPAHTPPTAGPSFSQNWGFKRLANCVEDRRSAKGTGAAVCCACCHPTEPHQLQPWQQSSSSTAGHSTCQASQSPHCICFCTARAAPNTPTQSRRVSHEADSS